MSHEPAGDPMTRDAEPVRRPGSRDAARVTPSGPDVERMGALVRSEHSMVVVRIIAVAFTVMQVALYSDRPFPSPWIKVAAFATAGVLAAGIALTWVALRRVDGFLRIRTLATWTLALDILVASTYVWLWVFDPGTAIWVVLFILPLEAATKFQLRGALAVWGIVTLLYIGREIYGEMTYDDFTLQWNSITFRMGIGLLIALVAGFMARNLTEQREVVAEALDEAHRTDRLRSRLVSTLAHDVRGPLTSIRGALQVVLRHPEQLDDRTRIELLTTADHQARRLERLATDLLDLARLERGRLELTFTPVRLSEVVGEALSYVDTPEAVQTRIDGAIELRADPGRLEQIVVNLVTNSLRYGAPPIVVEAAASNGRVELSVSDHGPGVPQEEQQDMFEPFRLDRTSGSVGLGLAIVKALTEAHGGGVSYRDNEPNGARFVVTLPVAGPPARR